MIKTETFANSEIDVTFDTYLRELLPWSQRLSFNFLLANFATRIASYIFLLARSAESGEKKASSRDRWKPHFHAISF